jgi:hypothetical protein
MAASSLSVGAETSMNRILLEPVDLCPWRNPLLILYLATGWADTPVKQAAFYSVLGQPGERNSPRCSLE